MPAPSKAMRAAAAIAEHHPEQLYKRNRSLLGMSHQQLHEFASTSEQGLPTHTKDRMHGRKNRHLRERT